MEVRSHLLSTFPPSSLRLTSLPPDSPVIPMKCEGCSCPVALNGIHTLVGIISFGPGKSLPPYPVNALLAHFFFPSDSVRVVGPFTTLSSHPFPMSCRSGPRLQERETPSTGPSWQDCPQFPSPTCASSHGVDEPDCRRGDCAGERKMVWISGQLPGFPPWLQHDETGRCQTMLGHRQRGPVPAPYMTYPVLYIALAVHIL